MFFPSRSTRNSIRVTVIGIIVLASCLLPLPTYAASLRAVENPHCFAILEGQIGVGDYEKIKGEIEAILPPRFADDGGLPDVPIAICLNSPGGSIPSAVKLAEFFWGNQIGTVIDANASCLSACSLIFMMGTEDYSDFNILHRKMHISGTLGFHRPSLKLAIGQDYTSAQVEKSFEIAIDSTLFFLELANRQVSEGAGPMLAVDLLENMFSHRSQDFFYIDTVDKAGRWDVQIFGYEPPPTISLREAQTACDNGVNWTMNLTSKGTGTIEEDSLSYLARIGRFDMDQRTASYRVSSNVDLHDMPLCVVDYAIEKREWSETGKWVEICGINRDYCWRGDGVDITASSISFAPIVIFPSKMLLKDIPSYLLRIPEHIARINSSWADFTPRSCMIQNDTWRTVVNVKNFANLRSKPNFQAPVVAQAPLHLSLKAASSEVYLLGSDADRASCNTACTRLENEFGEDIEAQVAQCFNQNNIWYSMSIPETGQTGFISGKYLR